MICSQNNPGLRKVCLSRISGSLTAVLLVAISSLGAESTENIVHNGGFEEWLPVSSATAAVNFENGEFPDGWTSGFLKEGVDSSELPVVARDNAVKHGGGSSVRLEPVGELPLPLAFGSSRNSWHPTPIKVQPGTKYLLRGWMKGEDLISLSKKKSLNVTLSMSSAEIDVFFRGGARVVYQSFGEDGSSDWIPFEIKFETSPEETTLFLSFSFLGTGKIWLDDIEIIADKVSTN